MSTAGYCLVEDVLRRFDPTLDRSDLDTNEFVPNDGLAKVESAIQSLSDEFDQDTGHAFRETRVGSPGAEATYETHGVDHEKYRRGVKVWLDHREVLPLDYDAGDRLEIRTGRRSWRDLTQQEDVRWNANYETGWIRIHSGFRTPTKWNREIRDKNIRITYRYGALGGDRDRGGETTLDGDIDDSENPTVEDPSRLPHRGVVSVGGDEYVEYQSLDYDTGELSGVTRGDKATTASAHDSGEVVHYCPAAVTEAVADAVAAEMVTYDDWVDRLVDSDKGLRHKEKIDQWTERFEKEKARRAEAHIV